MRPFTFGVINVSLRWPGALGEFNPAHTSSVNFISTTRLYRLSAQGELSSLLVQAGSLKEELSTPWTLAWSPSAPAQA